MDYRPGNSSQVGQKIPHFKNALFSFKCTLKDPSQRPPFSMPSKLHVLILHGEAKSFCFTVSFVPVLLL